MSTPTELELQLWLAKQSDDFHYNEASELFWWNKPEFDGERAPWVTFREWDYIVRRVEEKVENVSVYYLKELRSLLGIPEAWNLEGCIYKIATAPWPTRTIALMKVKGETK